MLVLFRHTADRGRFLRESFRSEVTSQMGCKCEDSQGTSKAEEREEWQISLKKTTGGCQQNSSLRRRSTHSLEIFKCLLESFKR